MYIFLDGRKKGRIGWLNVKQGHKYANKQKIDKNWDNSFKRGALLVLAEDIYGCTNVYNNFSIILSLSLSLA